MKASKRLLLVASAGMLLAGAGAVGATSASAEVTGITAKWSPACGSVTATFTNSNTSGTVVVTVSGTGGSSDSATIAELAVGDTKSVTLTPSADDTYTASTADGTIGTYSYVKADQCSAKASLNVVSTSCDGAMTVTVHNGGQLDVKVNIKVGSKTLVSGVSVNATETSSAQSLTGLAKGDTVTLADSTSGKTYDTVTYNPSGCSGGSGGGSSGGSSGGSHGSSGGSSSHGGNTTSSSSNSSLPVTGGATGLLVGLGLVLLVGGGVLTVAVRRRRESPEA